CQYKSYYLAIQNRAVFAQNSLEASAMANASHESKAPRKIRGAPFKSQQSYLRSLLLGFDALAGADRDLARLFRLGDFAHEVDVQQSVLEARGLDLDVVGELEHALEGARRDALVEHLAGFAFVLGVFLAADGERVLLGYDRELRLVEAGDRDGDAVV